METAFTLFLERNPAVEAERARLAMAEGRLRQSTAWANPVLHFSQEGYPLGRNARFDDQEFLLWASQELELGGKRNKRGRAAVLGVEGEHARFRDFLRRERLALSRAFVRVYFASERRDFLGSALREYSTLRQAHGRRFELGDVSGLAHMRFEAEELGYATRLAEADRELIEAWKKLAAFMVWDSDAMPRIVLDTRTEPSLPSLDALVRESLESRPDLAILRLDARTAEAEIEIERANRIPDLNLGGGYKRDFGQDSFFIGVQIPLPLLDHRLGAIEESIASSRRLRMLAAWKEIQIRREVEQAYEAVLRLLPLSRRFGPDFRDRLRAIVEVTSASYQAGEAGVLDYLDALRTRREGTIEQSRLRAELEIALIELEAAVGASIRGGRTP